MAETNNTINWNWSEATPAVVKTVNVPIPSYDESHFAPIESKAGVKGEKRYKDLSSSVEVPAYKYFRYKKLDNVYQNTDILPSFQAVNKGGLTVIFGDEFALVNEGTDTTGMSTKRVYPFDMHTSLRMAFTNDLTKSKLEQAYMHHLGTMISNADSAIEQIWLAYQGSFDPMA